MKLTGVIVLSALALQVQTATGLTAQEKALAAYIDAHNTEAEALLERAVNINSGSMNLEGVREVGRLFRAEFDALGFKTEWIDGAAWGRAGRR